MRLYRSRIPAIATKIVATLVADGDIEINRSRLDEVELDIKSVLDEYLRQENILLNAVRDHMEKHHLPYQEFGKIKKQLAEETNFPTGDDSFFWLANQIIESFMINESVEEVFAADNLLRRKIIQVFRENLVNDDDLEREARNRIKNISEDSPEWNLEFQKALKLVRERRGLK
ncbi:MAG: DUF507 family protein [Deltaproteobacteria bacterium]|nr:DUF507 family protein [Deltaproteobacteria bacterium]